MIVAAAIKTEDGKVHVAARHPQVFRVVAASIGLDYDKMTQTVKWFEYVRGSVQGFIDQHGKFYDREEALTHVQALGQFMTKSRDEHPGAVLTSEDLW